MRVSQGTEGIMRVVPGYRGYYEGGPRVLRVL